MVEGVVGVSKEDIVNILLELRHYVRVDKECWAAQDAKTALQDVANVIDNKLKEITSE